MLLLPFWIVWVLVGWISRGRYIGGSLDIDLYAAVRTRDRTVVNLSVTPRAGNVIERFG